MTKLLEELEEQRQIALKANKKAERIMKTINRRQQKGITLEGVSAANAEERKKFGCLIHTSMKVAFVVADLQKNGVITKIDGNSVHVVENESGIGFNVTKTELLPLK